MIIQNQIDWNKIGMPCHLPTKTGDEEDDFMSQLNDDEEEDTDLFGGTATSAGKAAVVDSATARRNLSSFDFSL